MEGFLGIIYLASCQFILTEKPLHPLLKYIVFYLFIFARYATSCLYTSLSCITWGTWHLLGCLTGTRPRGSIRSHDKARPPLAGRTGKEVGPRVEAGVWGFKTPSVSVVYLRLRRLRPTKAMPPVVAAAAARRPTRLETMETSPVLGTTAEPEEVTLEPPFACWLR